MEKRIGEIAGDNSLMIVALLAKDVTSNIELKDS